MGEKLDVVDAQGNTTGEVVDKKFAHTHHVLHNCGDVWVINDKKEILLQQRSKNKTAYPLHWDVSAAGHVSAGETVREGTARELYEELGIKAKPEELIFVDKIITVAELPKLGQDRKHMINVFIYKYKGEKFKLEPMEVAQVKWMSLDEFEQSLNSHDGVYLDNKVEYYKKVIGKVKQLI